MNFNYFIILLISFFILTACNNENKSQIKVAPSNQYASLFEIKKHSDYTEILIFNPWKLQQVESKFYLVSKKIKIPALLKGKKNIIRTPISSIITLSSTHIGFVAALNQQNSLLGHNGLSSIYDSTLCNKVKIGKIKAVGDGQNINVETIVNLNPTLLIATGSQIKDKNLALIEKSGIPVIYNFEWMETNILARSEWIKLFGCFYEEEEKSTLLFDTIVKEYLSLKTITASIKNKPSVLVGNKYKETWWVPGGNSFMAQLLEDAGFDYYWKSQNQTGSIALNIEKVIEKQLNTTVWINPGTANSIQQLVGEDNKYAAFLPVKKQEVYNYTNKINQLGANDYWESGIMNPHLILKDLIYIANPTLLPNHVLYYYKKLPEA